MTMDTKKEAFATAYRIVATHSNMEPEDAGPLIEAIARELALRAPAEAVPVAWTDKNGLEFLRKGYGIDVSAERGATGRTVPLFTHSAPAPDVVEALRDAIKELDEAADKFWVIHCNHPGDRCGRAQGEDKAFLAEMSDRMRAARNRARAALSTRGREAGERNAVIAECASVARNQFGGFEGGRDKATSKRSDPIRHGKTVAGLEIAEAISALATPTATEEK